jgi:hypothetical protein
VSVALFLYHGHPLPYKEDVLRPSHALAVEMKIDALVWVSRGLTRWVAEVVGVRLRLVFSFFLFL